MASESNRGNRLNVFFFPILARGHMIPMLGIAKHLAERGVGSTIVTTSGNAPIFAAAVDGAVASGHSMHLLLIPFPGDDVGLPSGCENTSDVTTEADKMKIFQAMDRLEQPLQQLLRDRRPDCLVGDISLSDSLTARAARSAGTPYLELSSFSAFSGAVIDRLIRASPSAGPLVGLPHRIELTGTEIPLFLQYRHSDRREMERERPAVIINTFQELEPEYLELMRDGGKRKVWCVGPVHLLPNNNNNNNNNNNTNKLGCMDMKNTCTDNGHGYLSDTDSTLQEECPYFLANKCWERIKKWLDCREAESVLYVCFGSECSLGRDQLREIARGLQASLQPFLWVVRRNGGGAETMGEWLPEGFVEDVEGRGLVLTEWAPQTSILSHPAVGGSMAHCGWNTSMEVIGAGLPVIVWPLHAEQFINERQFVEVIGTGVRVFHGEMRIIDPEKRKLIISGEEVKEAVWKLFDGGEEGKERRRKAKEYGKLARSAVEEGGSSYVDITRFLEELTDHCALSGSREKKN